MSGRGVVITSCVCNLPRFTIKFICIQLLGENETYIHNKSQVFLMKVELRVLAESG